MNKEKRKIIAEKHTKANKEEFSTQIKESIAESRVYGYQTEEKNSTIITVEDLTSEKAIEKYAPTVDFDKISVLNFASFVSPGGGFIRGSIAQEEALCHSSFLYNVLSDEQFEEFYRVNQENKNNGLYKNFAIFSPRVFFNVSQEEPIPINVITCAAPNAKVFLSRNANCYSDLHRVMKDRIRFILNIAEKERQKILILGAFGCGVFGNNPTFVANAFKEELKYHNFEKVVFAIPKGENLTSFGEVFDIEK